MTSFTTPPRRFYSFGDRVVDRTGRFSTVLDFDGAYVTMRPESAEDRATLRSLSAFGFDWTCMSVNDVRPAEAVDPNANLGERMGV